jgi:hypothetical protein
MEKKIVKQALPEPPPRTASKPLPPAKPLLPEPLSTTPPTLLSPSQPYNLTHLPNHNCLPLQAPQPLKFTTAQQPIPVPRTTEYHNLKRQLQQEESSEAGGSKRKYTRKACLNTCKHCKFPKMKYFGHSRHIGIHSVGGRNRIWDKRSVDSG